MQIGSVQSSAASLASAITKLTSMASYDPADTNQDGVVSAAEELAYALKHPELVQPTAAPMHQYTQSGHVNAVGNSAGGSLNLLA